MLNRNKVVIGIDTGNLVSGVVALIEGQIQLVKTMENKEVFSVISGYMVKYRTVRVIVEDIKPYAGNLSQQAIDTCKFIGQLTWRLDEIRAEYIMLNRSNVRKWVYDTFFQLVIPLVSKRIEQRNAKNNDGKNRKPSFVYVNDGIVLKAMKELWKIETPPPGKGYIHGLQTHTWQALALASCFSQSDSKFAAGFPQISEGTPFFGQQVT
jgi:hypothetical protein